MAAIKDIMIKRKDEFLVHIKDLHIKPGWNCRFKDFDPTDPVDIEFARDIAENNVREALTIWRCQEQGLFFIENGHRRIGAIRHILDSDMPTNHNLEQLYVRMSTLPDNTSDAERLWSQKSLNEYKKMSPLEYGQLYHKARSAGMSQGDIAKRAGATKAYVGQLCSVIDCGAQVVDYVHTGRIKMSLAIKIIQMAERKPKEVLRLMTAALKAAKLEGKTEATLKHVPKPTDVAEEAVPKETKRVKRNDDSVTRLAQAQDAWRQAFIAGFPEDDEMVLTFKTEHLKTFAAILGVAYEEDFI